jgi:YVTN family beta-propeller protein
MRGIPCDVARPSVGARSAVVLALLVACGRSHHHGPRIFVTNENDGTVTAIDAKSLEVIDTIAVGKRPRGVHVSHDGKRLYVALSGSPKAGPGVSEPSMPPPNRGADGIGIVDLDSLTLVNAIASGQDPESFDLVDDHTLVVSNEETAQASIVDVASHTVKSAIAIGKEPEGVAIAPDGTAWVTSEGDGKVFVIDPKASKVVATVVTGARPRGVAFAAGHAFITNENDGTLTVADIAKRAAIGTIELPPVADGPARPMGIAVSNDGKQLFVTEGRARGVAVVNAETNALVVIIPDVGARPWGVAVAPNGLVFTANGSSNDISVIDPKTYEVIHHVKTGGSPWGIAVAP